MSSKMQNRDSAAQRESFTELLGQLASKSATVVRCEIELVIRGIREQVREVRGGVLTVVTGTAISFAAFLCLCAALVIGLTSYMSPLNAALVTGALLTFIGAIVIFIGYRLLKKPIPAAQKTMQNEKEDREWGKENI
ncbi:MAG: phage holin family protein [Desulfococcaceae bacterium]|jgi:uncharacterized membrane protein YqjE|nr:phage holin family protein [Desulfococcaceae bacterium]